jgi:hypothetical protein
MQKGASAMSDPLSDETIDERSGQQRRLREALSNRSRALSRRRFLRLTGITTLTTVSALVAGCGSGAGRGSIGGGLLPTPTPPPGSREIEIRPDVVVIPADGTVVVSALTPTSVTLSGGIASALVVGSVIVSGDGDGFLRRITAIAPDGAGGVVAQTRTATLAEVFERAEFTLSKVYRPEEIDFSKAEILNPAVSVLPAPTRSRQIINDGIDATFLLPFNALAITSDTPADNVSVTAELDGDFSLGIRLDWTFRYDPQGLAEATITAGVDGASTLALTLKGKGVFLDKSIDILKIGLPRFTFAVGPIPIVITPIVVLSAGVEGAGETGLEIKTDCRVQVTGGMRYLRDQFPTPIGSLVVTGNPLPKVNFFGSLSLEATLLSISQEFLIYGLAGPFIKMKAASVKASVEAVFTTAEVTFAFDAVFGASAGITTGDLLGMLFDGIDDGFEVQFAELEIPIIEPIVFKPGQGAVDVK